MSPKVALPISATSSTLGIVIVRSDERLSPRAIVPDTIIRTWSDFVAEVLGFDKYSEVTTELAVKSTFCDLPIKFKGKLEFLIECPLESAGPTRTLDGQLSPRARLKNSPRPFAKCPTSGDSRIVATRKDRAGMSATTKWRERSEKGGDGTRIEDSALVPRGGGYSDVSSTRLRSALSAITSSGGRRRH